MDFNGKSWQSTAKQTVDQVLLLQSGTLTHGPRNVFWSGGAQPVKKS